MDDMSHRACAEFCGKLLSEQMVSCFGNVADLQHLATAIALTKSRPPNIVWDKDMSRLSYQGQLVDIRALHEGLQDMMKDVDKMMDELSEGHKLAYDIPDDLMDDLT